MKRAVMLTILILAGCSSVESSVDAEARQCRETGLQPGSEAYAGCVAKLAKDRQALEDANRVRGSIR